jgi:hypothetical protein
MNSAKLARGGIVSQPRVFRKKASRGKWRPPLDNVSADGHHFIHLAKKKGRDADARGKVVVFRSNYPFVSKIQSFRLRAAP